MTTPRKPGRPHGTTKPVTRTHKSTQRYTDEEFTAIEKAAHPRKVGDFIRKAAVKAAKEGSGE